MKRDNHNAGDPLEPGNPLKTGNFDKFWFQVLIIMLVLVLLISIWFFFFAKRHHPSTTGASQRTPGQTIASHLKGGSFPGSGLPKRGSSIR